MLWDVACSIRKVVFNENVMVNFTLSICSILVDSNKVKRLITYCIILFVFGTIQHLITFFIEFGEDIVFVTTVVDQDLRGITIYLSLSSPKKFLSVYAKVNPFINDRHRFIKYHYIM